jgi:hypothetical protein
VSALPPLSVDPVQERLDSAQTQLTDFLALAAGKLSAADVHERQRLIQEFFFHLLGATDFLAQYINEARVLGLDFEDVSMGDVHQILPVSDSLGVALRALYARTRRMRLPSDPYSDDALVFRAYNYRHLVTHRRSFPFIFRVGAAPPASLILDPRLASIESNQSVEPHDRELKKILAVVTNRIAQAIAAI